MPRHQHVRRNESGEGGDLPGQTSQSSLHGPPPPSSTLRRRGGDGGAHPCGTSCAGKTTVRDVFSPFFDPSYINAQNEQKADHFEDNIFLRKENVASGHA